MPLRTVRRGTFPFLGQRIEIFRTRVTNQGVESLGGLTTLAAVKLHYTAVDDQALDKLRIDPQTTFITPSDRRQKARVPRQSPRTVSHLTGR
jgi:hypothetical protein